MRCRIPVVCMVVSALSLSPSGAQGQNTLAMAPGRAPQFLLASERRSDPPVAVDVATVPMLRRRLSLDLDNVSRAAALSAISRTSGLRLVFAKGVVPREGLVRLKAQEITVAAALTEVLLDAGVDVVLTREGSVVLVTRAHPPLPATGVITGRVMDAQSGSVLQGADVVLEGTRWRTTTDEQGRYRLAEVPAGTYLVAARRIGYNRRTQTVRVADGAEVTADIALEPAALNLDAIVVTGSAGASQRRAIGNAVSTLQVSDVIETAPVTNLGQVLNARAPGVMVQSGSGIVGGGPRIQIRGRASFGLSEEPLLYIDGIRADNAVARGPGGAAVVSRLNDINPSEIESIEIIKGPAAATLYGTEASNGVVQVITKRGRAGDRGQVDVMVRQGANWFMNLEDRWPTQYARNPATGEVLTQNLAQLEAARGTPLYQTGHTQNYSVGASGGTGTLRYHFGTQFDREEGIDPDNIATRWSGRTNLDFSPLRGVEIGANSGVVIGRTKLGHEDGGTTPIFAGLQGSPLLLTTPTRGFLTAPPEAMREAFQRSQDLNRFTGGVRINHSVGSVWTHRLTAGLDIVDEQSASLTEFLRPEVAQFFSSQVAAGSRSVLGRQVINTTVDYAGTLTTPIGRGLTSGTSVGAQIYHRATRSSTLTGQGFPAPGVTSITGAAIRTVAEDFVENTTVGVFVQEQLSFGNRLFLTGAVRADDNSAFGENFDVVVYPKVSTSWVVREQGTSIGALKLRAAFGAAGQQPDAFAAVRTFAAVTGVGGQSTVTPQSIGNPDLKPERGEELELGFEASLFRDRVGIDFTYFHQTIKDAILARNTPLSTGFPGQQFVNIGKVRNSGIELLVDARAIDTKAADLDLTVNLATANNKVLEIGIPGQDFISTGLIARHQVGYPLAGFWVKQVVSASLDGNGNPIDVLCNGGPGQAPLPCAQAQPIYLGRSTPNVLGAVSAALTLGDRLRLSGLIDFRLGFRNFDNSTVYGPCVLARVCEENVYPERFDPTRIAEIRLGTDIVTISQFIPDASFAKLREVSATYTLTDRWAKSLFGARRASVAIAGRNLHTWTDYPSFDPESIRLGSATPTFNFFINQANLPLPAQFQITLNVSF